MTKAKVLVVDDSLSGRKVVERALVAKAMHVVSAGSGAEAIEQFERERPDLVVCDVVMPDRDGYEICQFVKTHPELGQTPVLLISSIVNSTVLAAAARVRSDDVLRKPFEASELVRKVSELLASGAVAATAGRSAASEIGPRTTDDPAPSPGTPSATRPDALAAPLCPATPTRGFEEVSLAAPAETPAQSLEAALGQLLALAGVEWVALADREGFLVGCAGEAGMEGEVAAALASCLAECSEGIGRELGRGALAGMLLEYERGTLMLQGARAAVLVALLRDAAALGKVRDYVKKALPELVRLISGPGEEARDTCLR